MGTTGIHLHQFLPMPLTMLSSAVGTVATVIRQHTNAGDPPIYTEGRLPPMSWFKVSDVLIS
jgi:hypothetical protein